MQSLLNPGEDISQAEAGGYLVLAFVVLGVVVYVAYEIANYDPTNPNGPIGQALCDFEFWTTCGAAGSSTNAGNWLTNFGTWLDNLFGTCTATEGGSCSSSPSPDDNDDDDSDDSDDSGDTVSYSGNSA
jgi:hypothetical protein